MKKKKFKLKIVILTLLILLIITAFYNGLIVKNYKIITDKLPPEQSIKIVLITDLHSHIYGKDQIKIVNKIKNQNPDLIALVGDIIDDEAPTYGAKIFLNAIKDIAPVYYATGNHEVWTRDVLNIKNMVKSYGIKVLENNYEPIDINGIELIIAGVEDPDIIRYERPESDWYKEVYKGLIGIDNNEGYKILLSHRPEFVDFYNTLNIDMVLSGHAHGGQVRIPFMLNGLYAPNQGFFPKYAGGVFKHENYTHIVSRGTSYNPRLPRIFNPPEVVVITIRGE